MIYLEDIIQKHFSDRTLINPNAEILSSVKHFLQNGNLSESQILDELTRNPNIISSYLVKKFIEDGIIDVKDLEKVVDNENIIRYLLSNYIMTQYSTNYNTLKELCDPNSTEVLFWGTECCGKSTLLGMLLSYMSFHYSMSDNVNCQGYNMLQTYKYMYESKNAPASFMCGNVTTSFTEMSFLIKEKKTYPITFLEMPGLIARAAYQQFVHNMLSDDVSNMIDCVLSVCKHSNKRKIHIFCLPKDALRIEWDGLPRSSYMVALLQFIINYNIISSGDHVLILSTKEDPSVGLEEAIVHIKDDYAQFYNLIASKSRELLFDLRVLPFSVGQVYFQDIVIPDFTLTIDVVNYIMDKIKFEKKQKTVLSRIKNIFAKH